VKVRDEQAELVPGDGLAAEAVDILGHAPLRFGGAFEAVALYPVELGEPYACGLVDLAGQILYLAA